MQKKTIKSSYYKNNNNEEIWSEYNRQGQLTYRKEKFNGVENEFFWEFDANGNIVHSKDSWFEYFAEYDNNGNKIYYKDSDGNEWRKEFDENDNELSHNDINVAMLQADGNIPINTRKRQYTNKYNKNGHHIFYVMSVFL